MKLALLFPGQGSQTVGMGKALFETYSVAKAVFEEVDDALNQKLSHLMFEGPSEALTLTENAQPAIMAVSIAAQRVLEAELGFDIRTATYAAGHSLGEYSALCATRALSLAETARLLKLRGQSMQQSVPNGKGAMAAILGVDIATAEAIVAEAKGNDVLAVANDNADGQIVISGTKEAVDRAIEVAKTKGAKRSVLLQVSAPFHCPLMAPAAGIMAEALAAAKIASPVVPVIANMTAKPITSPDDIRRLLVDQVTGVVRWRETMDFLNAEGMTAAYEVGAGKVLTGLAKRACPNMKMQNLGEPADFAAALQAQAA
jgi:[acyl-carrier-protein] S-malonyltransferase